MRSKALIWTNASPCATRSAVRRQPCQGAIGRRDARAEAGLQQIAAGRSLPVQHFAGGEHARMVAQHQRRVQGVRAQTAGGGNRPLDRSGRHQTDRQRFDQRRQVAGVGARVQRFLHQPDGFRRQARLLAQRVRQRLTATRVRRADPSSTVRLRSGRRSTMDCRGSLGLDRIAEPARTSA